MASTFISRTLASNGQEKGTISGWFKLGVVDNSRALCSTYSDANNHAMILLSSNNNLDFFDYQSGYESHMVTNAHLNDSAAWYHVVYTWDQPNATENQRNRAWINGVEISGNSGWATEEYYGSSATPSWNKNYSLNIGARNSDQYWSGQMSHFYFIQGYCYTATDFGEFDSDGIWKIKTSASVNYGGTGANSCFLKMEDASNLDLDSGDNTVAFTTTGTLTSTKDTPSNNFPTFSPMVRPIEAYSPSWSNGNTTIAASGGSSWQSLYVPTALTGGLWYYEYIVSSGTNVRGGFASSDQLALGGSTYGPNDYATNGVSKPAYQMKVDGDMCFSNSSSNNQEASYGSSYAGSETSTYVGVYLDLSASKIYFALNGVLQNSGTGYSIESTGYSFMPVISVYPATTVDANFGNGCFGSTQLTGTTYNDAGGEGIFKYDPSSGTFDGTSKNFRAICSKNIKDYD